MYKRQVGMGGISADDDLAVEKLTKKLEGLESQQTTMKEVNAYFRKHKTLDGCPELTPEQAEKLKADMAVSYTHLIQFSSFFSSSDFGTLCPKVPPSFSF